MPTAAPLTGEVFLDRLAERLCSMYEHCMKYEQERLELRSAKYLVVGSLQKTKDEFGALATLLKSSDPILDVWVEVESTLDETAATVRGMAIALPDVTDSVRSLLILLLRQVKKGWPVKTVVISARMKELDSKRVLISAS